MSFGQFITQGEPIYLEKLAFLPENATLCTTITLRPKRLVAVEKQLLTYHSAFFYFLLTLEPHLIFFRIISDIFPLVNLFQVGFSWKRGESFRKMVFATSFLLHLYLDRFGNFHPISFSPSL